MSSVWVEKNGNKYRVRYVDASGKKKTAGSYPNKMIASAQSKKMRDNLVRAPSYIGQVLTLTAVLESYLEHRTCSGYVSEGHAFEARRSVELAADRMGWNVVTDITPESIDAWSSEYKVVSAWRVLRAVLRYARIELDQPIPEKVIHRKLKKKVVVKKEPDLMPDDLVHTALERAELKGGVHGVALVHWLVTYGCRPITLLHMQVGDVDLEGQSVFIRHNKNKMEYRHALAERTIDFLKPICRGREPGERLFCDPRTDEPWVLSNHGTAQRIGEWYQKNISKDFPPQHGGIYALKDWCITRLVESGLPDHQIILFTGHQGTISLQRYKKSNLQKTREIVSKLPTL